MSHEYRQAFASHLIAIEQNLHAFCSSQTEAGDGMQQMIRDHFGWDDPVDLSHPNGKRTRPLLLLLTAEAIAGGYKHALPAAVGIELIHNFTLIHDDVMDKSLERRGRPTLWAIRGIAQAINAGDGLYTIGLDAFGTMNRDAETMLRATQIAIRACRATVKGQILDVSFEARARISVHDYLDMIYHKSGVLIEASARLGAILSTDDSSVVAGYADFAKYLGIAFQIQDDYLGIWGAPGKVGKSTSSDITNKKKSYPILLALNSENKILRAEMERIFHQESLTQSDVATVKTILAEVGAPEKTRALVESYSQQSLEALRALPFANQRLELLSSFLMQRAY